MPTEEAAARSGTCRQRDSTDTFVAPDGLGRIPLYHHIVAWLFVLAIPIGIAAVIVAAIMDARRK
jgi:Ni,Fe-hydrogenase I cytochrome b subunit